MFVFTHPLMLVALAAVAVPIAIHFLTRPRPRRIALPTWHMLMEAGGGRQAMHRLRTWVILALRTIAVAAMALLFTRPLWTDAEAAADPDAKRRVVVIVDASLSMTAGAGGVSRFDAAKAQAAELIASLDSGSAAAVILAAATPHPVLPALSRNLAALRDGLDAAEPTMQRADPAGAISLAGRMLGGTGEIFVISDFQKTQWQRVTLAAPKGVAMRLRRVDSASVDNAGIVAVRLSPAEPLEGEPIELTASVFNASPRRTLHTVLLDVRGVSQKIEVEAAPYRAADAVFRFTLPAATEVGGRVSLEPDALIADNDRYFRLRVRRQLRVLLVSDSDKSDTTSGAFFVAKAISPRGDAEHGLTITRRLGLEVDRGSLETADVFVVVCPVRLTGESADIIARRVADGAALICLLDGPTATDTVNALAGASKGAIRPPFELTRPVVAGSSEGFALAGPRLTGGPLAVFDAPDAGDLSTLRVGRRFMTDIDPARLEQVVLRYADDVAAISMGPAGRGEVVFANLPLEPVASTAPGSPLFPVLMHELLRQLRRGGETAGNSPGLAWFVDVHDAAEADDQAKFTITGSDGEPVEAAVLSRGRTTRLALPPVERAGVYALRRGERALGVGVVNIDADETDLRAIDLSEAIMAAGKETEAVAVVDPHGRLTDAGRPKPMWPTLAAIAAATLALEMGLLAFWRKPKASRLSHRAAGMTATTERANGPDTGRQTGAAA